VRLRVLLDGMLILTLLVDLQYNWKSATATYKQPYLISSSLESHLQAYKGDVAVMSLSSCGIYHTITQLLDCIHTSFLPQADW